MIGPDLTESPIEKMLYQAFVEWIELEGDVGVEIECQHKISKYRTDFCFIYRGKPILVVECDGHEWHEKTPEQALRDKRRDREILIDHDIPTIRFTGREIYASAFDCAHEARRAAHALSFDMAWLHHLESITAKPKGQPSRFAQLVGGAP